MQPSARVTPPPAIFLGLGMGFTTGFFSGFGAISVLVNEASYAASIFGWSFASLAACRSSSLVAMTVP
jgi:hypothetical protein